MVYSGDVLAEKLHKKRRNKVMVIALGELCCGLVALL